MDFDPRDYDGRDRDDDRVYGCWGEDPRDRDSRERDLDPRERDPRDPFVDRLDLPRGLEREVVIDEREREYELNGEDSRMLATIGAFRVVRERDQRRASHVCAGAAGRVAAGARSIPIMRRTSYVRTLSE